MSNILPGRNFLAFFLAMTAAASIFFFYLFGITGMRMFFGIIIVSAPFYMILNNFNFTEVEKLVFSVLLGMVLFSAFVYLLGLVVSFRLSIVLVFIALLGISYVITKKKK